MRCLIFSLMLTVGLQADETPLSGTSAIFSGEILENKEIIIPEQTDGGISVSVFYSFKERQNESTLFSSFRNDTPFCSISILYDSEAFMEMIDFGKYPDLILPSGTIFEIRHLSSSHSATRDGEGNIVSKVTHASFRINPTTNLYDVRKEGVVLQRTDGKPSNNRLTGLKCFGDDLTMNSVENHLGLIRFIKATE